MAAATVLKEATFSLADLAEELGVADSTMRAWANGNRVPPAEQLDRIADALERRGRELVKHAKRLRGGR